MDKVLLFTILTIFLAAFVGTMIRYQVRDKCLKGFRDFFVTLEQTGGKRAWGRLNVFHNGIELLYPTPHLDSDGSHYETSYILYENQFNAICMLQRLHDELSPEKQALREKEIARTYHPNAFRRLGRGLRNLFNLLRDAFSQAATVFIGQIKKAGASTFVASQDARLSKTAQQIITSSADTYEPILERYIGKKVVLEIQRGDTVQEHCGILKDYSDRFIAVLDVPVSEEHGFNLADPEQMKINHDLDFDVRPSSREPGGDGWLLVDVEVDVTNRSSHIVHLCHAEGGAYNQMLKVDIPAGQTRTVRLEGVPLARLDGEADQPEEGLLPDVHLWIRASRFMDIVAPRTLATVRHGAESIGQLRIKLPFA